MNLQVSASSLSLHITWREQVAGFSLSSDAWHWQRRACNFQSAEADKQTSKGHWHWHTHTHTHRHTLSYSRLDLCLKAIWIGPCKDYGIPVKRSWWGAGFDGSWMMCFIDYHLVQSEFEIWTWPLCFLKLKESALGERVCIFTTEFQLKVQHAMADPEIQRMLHDPQANLKNLAHWLRWMCCFGRLECIKCLSGTLVFKDVARKSSWGPEGMPLILWSWRCHLQTDAPTFCRIVQIRKQIQSAVAYKYQTIPTPLCTQREAHVQNIYNYLTLHMYIYIDYLHII